VHFIYFFGYYFCVSGWWYGVVHVARTLTITRRICL